MSASEPSPGPQSLSMAAGSRHNEYLSLGPVTVRRPIVSHIRHTALQTHESKAY